MLINRLAIIGLGLMGGSLAKALRAAGSVREVIGFDLDAGQVRRALELNVIDRAAPDAVAAVQGADVVVLSVPVSETGAALAACLPGLAKGTVVTDVGSTKQSVLNAVQKVCGGLPGWFVPGHPIAGTEKSGVEAAQPDLFRGRRVILTPHAGMDPKAHDRVRQCWLACGAVVTEMDPVHHDEVLAATSHLPHVLAYALVNYLAGMNDQREIFAYAAGGFRDFTRIASSSPKMWHDIVRANREALLPVVDGYLHDLRKLRDAMAADDGVSIMECFSRAQAARERYLELVERPANGK